MVVDLLVLGKALWVMVLEFVGVMLTCGLAAAEICIQRAKSLYRIEKDRIALNLTERKIESHSLVGLLSSP